MNEYMNEPMREMIAIPLDEYKELLRCQGRVNDLEHQIDLFNETLNNNIRLFCTLAIHPDANA